MDQLTNFVAHSPQVQAMDDGPPSSTPFPGSRQPSFLTLMSELARCNSLALCDLPLLGATGAPVALPRANWLTDLHHCLQRARLNPAFGCFLMGLPPMWTNPAVTSCEQLEMEQYRSASLSQLSALLGPPSSLIEE